ncbi:MAG: murein L,D-transpeptidase [Burkholderiaceae bacterium]
MTLSALAIGQPVPATDASPDDWRERFVEEVDRPLEVPVADQQRYIVLLQQALEKAEMSVSEAQAFVLVDRSPQVQAAFVIMRTPSGEWQWTGASPVSTGKVSTFDHFITPLGVFAHTLANPDFRSGGTFNENHIRGYGLRGRRVFDFGWAIAARGWGKGGTSQMRLQMHATDPATLEPLLGRVESKGCIRIPASLNVFLDRHGILDADCEEEVAGGKPLWVLGHERGPIARPGRYLVIVDSMSAERPAWSPLPLTE